VVKESPRKEAEANAPGGSRPRLIGASLNRLTLVSTEEVDVGGMALYRQARVGLNLSRKLPRSPSLAPLCLLRPSGRLTFTSMAPNSWIPNRYPQSRCSDHVDIYKSKAKGSVKVPDPYNWLEQNSEETARWVTEQEKYTREYIRSSPDWGRVEADIRKVTDYSQCTDTRTRMRVRDRS
jgi:hypothetical protein